MYVGFRHTAATKAKMRASRKAYFSRVGEAAFIPYRTKEYRKRRSRATLALRRDPAYVARHLAGIRRAVPGRLGKGHPHTEATRNRLSVVARNRPPEHAESISRTMCQQWQDPVMRSKRLKGMRAKFYMCPNGLELAMSEILDELGVLYEFQYLISGFCVDFMLPDVALVLECDGEPWHRSDYARARDGQRDTVLKELGLTVLRFTWTQVTYDSDYVFDRLAAYV